MEPQNNLNMYEFLEGIIRRMPDKVKTAMADITVKPYKDWKTLDNSMLLAHRLTEGFSISKELEFINEAERVCKAYNIEYVPQDFEKAREIANRFTETLKESVAEVQKAIRTRREACTHPNEKYAGHDSHHDYFECPDCGKITRV